MKYFSFAVILCIAPIFVRSNLTKAKNGKAIKNYSELELNEKALKGSRWSLEQTNITTVYHTIDIVDAVLTYENQMTLNVEFFMIQKWTADLKFPEGLFQPHDPEGASITVDKKALNDMWTPDFFIPTARGTVTTVKSAVHILSNQTIFYKARMFTKVACTSDFQLYPLDTQQCSLRIESFKYRDNVVQYTWDPILQKSFDVKMKRLLQYELTNVNDTSDFKSRGVLKLRYAYVMLNFTFARRLGNNLIQVYTPTTLVVVLSWFNFWLGLDAVAGRVSLLVTCMLTLVTMHSGMHSLIPPVHYITMMDVWYVGCMSFVFVAICEFVTVKYLHWKYVQLKKKRVDTLQTLETCMNLIMTGLEMRRKGWDNNLGRISVISQNLKSNDNIPFSTAIKRSSSVPTPLEANMGQISPTSVTSNRNQEILKSFLVGATQVANDLEQGKLEEMKDCSDEANKVRIWVTLDKVCRLIFPLLFCGFNLIYWSVLLTEARNHKHYIPH